MDASKFHYNSPRFRAIKKWYRLKISSELTSFFFLSHFYSFHANLYLFYCFVRFISFFFVFRTHTLEVCHPWIVNETRIYFKMSTKLHNLCDMLDAVCVYEYVNKARNVTMLFIFSMWSTELCISLYSNPLQWLVEWHCTSEFPLFLTFFIFFFFSTHLSSSSSYASFYFCSAKNNWHCRKFMVNIFDAFQLI